MNKYLVTVTNQGNQFWLRGTTWAFHADRANLFDTEQQAREVDQSELDNLTA